MFYRNPIRRFMANHDGTTAVEYGLIAGLISVAIIATLTTIGGSLTSLFTTIATTLTSAAAA
jgi:pilus assembly protein Flp/PilA